MKELNLFIKKNELTSQISMIFQLLGRFADRLPDDVSNEMRTEAASLQADVEKIEKKLQKIYN